MGFPLIVYAKPFLRNCVLRAKPKLTSFMLPFLSLAPLHRHCEIHEQAKARAPGRLRREDGLEEGVCVCVCVCVPLVNVLLYHSLQSEQGSSLLKLSTPELSRRLFFLCWTSFPLTAKCTGNSAITQKSVLIGLKKWLYWSVCLTINNSFKWIFWCIK